jgi:GDP-fucose transporter C1
VKPVAPVEGKPARSLLKVSGAVGGYCACSIAVVLLNKWVLAAGTKDGFTFKFPVFMTWFQMVMAGVFVKFLSVTGITGNFIKIPPLSLNYELCKLISPVTIAFIAMLTCGNMCLGAVQVSFFQVAKSLHIIASVLLSYCYFGQTTSIKSLAACALICCGYVVASIQEVFTASKVDMSGLITGVFASFFTALYPIVMKEVFNDKAKPDQWVMLYLNSMMSGVLMIPLLFIFGEFPRVLESPAMQDPNFWFRMLCASFVGFLLNITTYINVLFTTPLTHMIAGSAKGGLQSFLGVWIFGNTMTQQGLLGQVLILGGSFMYSLVGYWARQAKEKESKKE